jgi:hypothetical protein
LAGLPLGERHESGSALGRRQPGGGDRKAGKGSIIERERHAPLGESEC